MNRGIKFIPFCVLVTILAALCPARANTIIFQCGTSFAVDLINNTVNNQPATINATAIDWRLTPGPRGRHWRSQLSYRSHHRYSDGKLYISSSERQHPIGLSDNLPLHCEPRITESPTLSTVISIGVSQHIPSEIGMTRPDLARERRMGMRGGPGRTRTSNQTVMSDMPYREVAIKPRSIASDCTRSTPFVHGHSVGLLREEAPRPYNPPQIRSLVRTIEIIELRYRKKPSGRAST
jgi:hypothetical protein